MDDVIEDFITRDSSFAQKMREMMKTKGRHIEDLTLVHLLAKRLERQDCREKGWILEDFPQTRF